jgi:uncharacterized protein
MILDLREFETFPAHTLLEGDPENFVIDYEGLTKVNKVSHKLDIQQSGEEYFCQGKVSASVTIECSRCLKLFERHLDEKTDFIVCSKPDEEEKENIPDNEDYAYFIGSDIQVDITDITRQAIILAVSMKPLCNENCRGLCQDCGANLNDSTCNCSKETIDPRWEGLKNLSGIVTEKKD